MIRAVFLNSLLRPWTLIGPFIGLWLFSWILGRIGVAIGPYLFLLKVAFAISFGIVLIGVAHKLEWTTKGPIGWTLDRLPSNIKDKIMTSLARLTNLSAFRAHLAQQQRAQFLDAGQIAEQLKGKVIGQNAVIDEFTSTIAIRLAKETRNRPVGVFLFAGPPGTGKTMLAKELAKALGRNMRHEDMTLCTNEAALWGLFGVPAGYSGGPAPGSITSALKSQPDSIILLDEIEKASKETHLAFLTPFDQGFTTDNTAKDAQIDATKAIFIMTTNAAFARIGEITKRISDPDQLQAAIADALRNDGFAPELISRIDEIFVFRPVEGEDAGQVVANQVEEMVGEFSLRVADNGIDFMLLIEAMNRSTVLQSAGGLRAVRRMIERKLGPQLASAKQHGAKVVSIAVDPDRGIDGLTVNIEE